MRNNLKLGLENEFTFPVSDKRIVPTLLPESEEFQMMPHVLATGYMVGLIEWTCIKIINLHIDWPKEMTVGTHINVSHVAATPTGFKIRIKVKLIEMEGRRLLFEVEADDGIDIICQGTHERFIIYPDKFNMKMETKRKQLSCESQEIS